MSKKKIKRKQQYRKPKERTFKEWWNDQSAKAQKWYKIGAIALAAIIVLLIVWYYAIYDDGSLRVSHDAIVGAQDTWLILEGDKGKNSKYYHVADVTVPEGFVVSAEGLGASSSSLRTDFTFDSETDSDVRLYVAPVSRTVDEMISQVYGSFTSMTAERGAITEVKEAGNGNRYFTYHYAYDDEMENTHYIQSLVYYTPAAQKGRCVLISANVYPETEEGYRDEADLLAIVQKVAAENLTLVKP
ncbi:MAG: hypothetical protein II481_06790 [Clostridia bacterium]|jgi:hypothetical protein|nr:hypothetical protein [Clostridia bacterium]